MRAALPSTACSARSWSHGTRARADAARRSTHLLPPGRAAVPEPRFQPAPGPTGPANARRTPATTHELASTAPTPSARSPRQAQVSDAGR
jgi:hypothetical protein